MIKKLSECRNDFLSSLYGKLSEFKTCEKLVKKHLPEKIAQHCKVTDTQNNTIVIAVANPGIMSLLRYEKPNLLKTLRTEEKMYALRSIELKLDAPHFRKTSYQPPEKIAPFSTKSSNNIHLTASHCSYSPLKKALEQLGKTLKEKAREN